MLANERRKASRERCTNLDAVIRSVQEPLACGIVRDVSTEGLGFAGSQAYEPGATLWLALREDERDCGLVEVRVAHSDYRPGMGWVVGCTFAAP